jgi:hypothetical protein
MTRSLVIIACLALCVAVGARGDEKKGSAVRQDTFVKVTSHLGNSFVAPSQWTTTDKGDTFSLESPDGRAVIHAIMFAAEGSGPLQAFRETIASGLLPSGATAWKASDWTPIKLGGRDAQKRELVPVPESKQGWRLYVMDAGRFYHAIILNASADAMALNGGFYEDIVRTFDGVRE